MSFHDDQTWFNPICELGLAICNYLKNIKTKFKEWKLACVGKHQPYSQALSLGKHSHMCFNRHRYFIIAPEKGLFRYKQINTIQAYS
jgi:hypothetical protein